MSSRYFIATSPELIEIFEAILPSRLKADAEIKALVDHYQPIEIGFSTFVRRYAVKFETNPDRKVFTKASNKKADKWYEPKISSELYKQFRAISDEMTTSHDAEKLIGYDGFHSDGGFFHRSISCQKLGADWWFSTHPQFGGNNAHCKRMSDVEYEAALDAAWKNQESAQ